MFIRAQDPIYGRVDFIMQKFCKYGEKTFPSLIMQIAVVSACKIYNLQQRGQTGHQKESMLLNIPHTSDLLSNAAITVMNVRNSDASSFGNLCFQSLDGLGGKKINIPSIQYQLHNIQERHSSNPHFHKFFLSQIYYGEVASDLNSVVQYATV